MRISDWSSDVCSSDLETFDRCFDEFFSFRINPDFAPEDSDFEDDDTAADEESNDSLQLDRLDNIARGLTRSEERRVGKECVRTGRYRWEPKHDKKNKKKHRD